MKCTTMILILIKWSKRNSLWKVFLFCRTFMKITVTQSLLTDENSISLSSILSWIRQCLMFILRTIVRLISNEILEFHSEFWSKSVWQSTNQYVNSSNTDGLNPLYYRVCLMTSATDIIFTVYSQNFRNFIISNTKESKEVYNNIRPKSSINQLTLSKIVYFVWKQPN